MGKSAVSGVVWDHLDTLRDARTGRLHKPDFATQYGLPALLSFLGCVWPLSIELRDVGQIVAGLAIFGGFMFGLVVYVFQLRLEAAREPGVRKDSALAKLLDELFANVSYAVLVCLAGAAAAVAASTMGSPDKAGRLGVWWSVVLVFFLVHALIVIGMCVKRTRRAYLTLTA